METLVYDPIAAKLGDWAVNISPGSIVFRIVLVLILSAVIGWERSSKRHSAGLRTFMLMTLGPTVSVMCDLFISQMTQTHLFLLSAASVIAEAVICVNCVLFTSRNQIKGLTTSAALWVCGILGVSCGAGYYTVTIVGFVALYCSLSIFHALERYLKDRANHFEIHLELKNASYLQDFVTTIRELGVIIDDIELNPAYVNSGLSVYSVAVSITSGELKKYKTHEEIIEALGTLDYVYYIEEMRG